MDSGKRTGPDELTTERQLATAISDSQLISDKIECWICTELGALEEHHIVPRAYGGTNGPTVRLCAICHAEIDKLSRKAFIFSGDLSTKGVLDYVKNFCYRWDNDAKASRAYKLARIIFRARRLVYKVPRPVKKTIKLSGAEQQQLKILKASFPNLTQIDVLHLALQELYDKEIGSTK